MSGYQVDGTGRPEDGRESAERRPGGGRYAGGAGGFALMWALLAVIGLTVIGVAAHSITSGDRMLSDNFEVEGRGLYAADAGLSEYFGLYAPLGIPGDSFVAGGGGGLTTVCHNGTTTDVTAGALPGHLGHGDTLGPCPGEDEGEVDSVLVEFHGSDLEKRSFDYLDSDVDITPLKLASDINGDVYLVTGQAQVDDPRTHYPRADRPVRTYGALVPPFQLLATVVAPNGFKTHKDAEHFHVEGKAKGKCGAGNIPALATPENTTEFKSKDNHIKSEDPYNNDPHDEDSPDVENLLERMGIEWDAMGDPAAYAGKENFVEVPGDYPDLESVDFKQWDKKKEKWPIVFHHGTADLSDQKVDKGHGLLIVEDSLIIGKEKLDWKGLIVVGRNIHVTADDGHAHIKGALVTGVGCTESEIAAGDCENLFEGKHLDVKFHACEVDAAWSQVMSLRPRGRTRYTPLYLGNPGVKQP